MKIIRLATPEVRGSRAIFRFEVEPPTGLYRQNEFSIDFPPDFDIARVPERLWWLVFFLCCSGQWPLLRPCRIVLPFALPPSEVEVWLRLFDAAVSTLEAYRPGHDLERSIAIETGDRVLPPILPLPPSERAALAFSAGKDSLIHAGLLRELLPGRHLLVATTSPVERIFEHQTRRRAEIFEAMRRHSDFEFVEVLSDIRTNWHNDFTWSINISVSQPSDIPIYLANLIVAAWARGVSRLFVASEAEVQENMIHEGRIVQHIDFMYAAAFHGVFARLLAPFGMTLASLTWSLPHAPLTRLFWRRYPDLTQFQYSCFRVQPDEATCSRCGQCFRLAYLALSAGGDPSLGGFDLVKLHQEFADWSPIPVTPPILPREAGKEDLVHATALAVAKAPWRTVVRSILWPRRGPRAAPRIRWRALRQARRLRRRLAWARREPWPGWHPVWLERTEPALRPGLRRVLSAESRPEVRQRDLEIEARSAELTAWITAPIDAAARARTA